MTTLPLPGLVALDTPRLALLLLAVEPRLKGVVLAGGAGTGKSSLGRGLKALLPESPFVELPVGTDDEALLGGLDLEATVRAGRRVLRPGLLARANGGILAIDGFNLLPESAANVLLGALEDGELRIERDGLSLRTPTQFCLVGGYDPAEGPPRAHLMDRTGLIVLVPPVAAADGRAEIVRRHLAPPASEWQEELDMLRGLVASARELLSGVVLAPDQERELLSAASACGVQGQRADYFAVLAARASAALGLRDQVQREDLELALRLVILPRATRQPEPPAEAPPPPEPAASSGDTSAEDTGAGEPEPVEELFDAVAVELPDALASLPFSAQRRGRSGSRGSTAGERGRHVGSRPGEVRGKRIDVIATLRAATRWQRLRPRPPGATARRVVLRAEDLRVKQFRSKAGALFVVAVDASGSMALNRMRQAKGAVHALLQQAYVNRDRVALLSFRGETAEILLPPSGSVELARRAVDILPTGGGTPTAAALLAGLGLAERARRRGIPNVVLILLTDGRANVGLRSERAGVDEELRQVAASVAASGMQSLVVDTQRSYLSQGSAQRLAGWLAGRYLYLPDNSGEGIAAAARAAVPAS